MVKHFSSELLVPKYIAIGVCEWIHRAFTRW